MEYKTPGPDITHIGPTTGKFGYWIGRLYMWIFGWKVEGKIPEVSKFVLIAAPHTSNWDLLFMLGAANIFRIKVSWIGKHTIFKEPFGPLMRWLGGIPINRESPQGLVAQIVDQYNEKEKLVIAIPPSGTRKKRDYWKSGFYWIAHSAQIPVCCGFLDYAKKEAGFGLSFVPTGDLKQDMNRIREFYSGIMGKNPEMTATIKLRDEEL